MNKRTGFTHDNVANVSVDWYTPPWIFERLGLMFDLDPCQPVDGIPWIPASCRYSERDNGLTSPWFGKVWLNPPYGKHTGAWFHDYVAHADAILFLRGRVRFVDGLGVTGGNGTGCGSMLIAWGNDNVPALLRMSDLGLIK